MSVSLLRCSCTRRGGSGTVAEPTLYLFDGHNLFHAGDYKDLRQLRDELASFVALKGARGYLVFDGSGADESYGPLEVRYAKNADTMLERLAAENRDHAPTQTKRCRCGTSSTQKPGRSWSECGAAASARVGGVRAMRGPRRSLASARLPETASRRRLPRPRPGPAPASPVTSAP